MSNFIELTEVLKFSDPEKCLINIKSIDCVSKFEPRFFVEGLSEREMEAKTKIDLNENICILVSEDYEEVSKLLQPQQGD